MKQGEILNELKKISDYYFNKENYISAGPASTYSKDLANTLKETTIDNKRIGNASNDITGKGYGYLSQDARAANTNKQFTCQEMYIAPANGEYKMKDYQDAYNAEITTNKESLQQYRAPTTCGINMGPDGSQINVQLRNDNNKMRDPNPGYIENNFTTRMHQISQQKIPVNNISNRFMDPMLMQQLQSNPYHISIQI